MSGEGGPSLAAIGALAEMLSDADGGEASLRAALERFVERTGLELAEIQLVEGPTLRADRAPAGAALADGGELVVPLGGVRPAGVLVLGSTRLDLRQPDWRELARAAAAIVTQSLARLWPSPEAASLDGRYRMLMELARDAIWIVDRDGTIIDANAAAGMLTGRSLADLVGSFGPDVFVPAQRAGSREGLARGPERGDDQLPDAQFLRPDGAVVFADVAVSPVSISGHTLYHVAARDVTERRAALAALEASEARYHSLLANFPDLVWSIDLDGQAIFAGGNAEKGYGFTVEELRATGLKGWLERVHPDEAPAVRAAFAAMFGGGDPLDIEYRFRRKDGAFIWLHSRASMVTTPAGVPTIEGFTHIIHERKTAALLERESEELHRTIFEACPVPMWVLDEATGSFLAVNGAAVATYGYTRAELLALSPEEIAGAFGGEHHRRKGGVAVDVEQVTSAISFGGRAARLVVATDVTERRRAERRQAALHGVARAVAESASLEEAAPRMLAALGSCVGATAGTLWEVTPEGEARAVGGARREASELVALALATGQPQRREAEGATSVAWPVVAGGQVAAIIELDDACHRDSRCQDETATLFRSVEDGVAQFVARLRSEAERDRLSRELLLFMDSTVEGIYRLDPDGTCRYANPAAARMLGYEPRELLGKNMHELAHHSHPDGTPYPASDCPIRGATQPTTGIETLWRRDGTSFPAAYRASPIVEQGITSGTVVTMVDSTNERLLEDQLRQAQKMEAIGQLAGGVAHDFNNILAAILAYTGFLIDGLQEGDARRDDAIQCREAAERAAALTRQLLAFSRQQVLEPRVVELNKVVGGVDKMLRRVIGEDIQLELDLQAGPVAVKADVGQLEQVLMNLAVNARDAMPLGGRLVIGTASVQVAPGRSEGGVPLKAGGYAVLSVRDSGHGMTEEVRKRVFEPFFTTKERGRGTGLGLSTCYGIVKQSGGYIFVRSEPGRGAAFEIYLPLAREQRESAAARAVERPAGGSETVLLIEDDEHMRRVTRRILGRHGYRVLEASDGAEAMALAAALPSPIDLILSDVVMPGPSGPEIVSRLKELGSTARVLFMSGYTDHAVLRDGMLPAGAEFVQKPFVGDVLVRRVRALLDGLGEGAPEYQVGISPR